MRYRRAGHQASVTPVTTGTEFTPANLRSQVSSDLAKYGTARATVPGSGDSPAAGPARQSATVGSVPLAILERCVDRIAAGQQVLLVEVAHYLRAPATVIVTRPPAASPEQVWVVGAGCSGARSDVLAHVTLAPGG